MLPSTASSASVLDPAITSLPGEERNDLSANANANDIPSEEIEPLNVRRIGPPLFVPFAEHGATGNDAGGVPLFNDAESDSSEGVMRFVGTPDLLSPTTGSESGQAEADDSDPVERGDDVSYRVRASFMADFLSFASSPPSVPSSPCESDGLDLR
jgi:hypothetical protein